MIPESFCHLLRWKKHIKNLIESSPEFKEYNPNKMQADHDSMSAEEKLDLISRNLQVKTFVSCAILHILN